MAYVCKQGSDFENVEDTKYTLSKFLVILVSQCTIYSKAICQVWFHSVLFIQKLFVKFGLLGWPDFMYQ